MHEDEEDFDMDDDVSVAGGVGTSGTAPPRRKNYRDVVDGLDTTMQQNHIVSERRACTTKEYKELIRSKISIAKAIVRNPRCKRVELRNGRNGRKYWMVLDEHGHKSMYCGLTRRMREMFFSGELYNEEPEQSDAERSEFLAAVEGQLASSTSTACDDHPEPVPTQDYTLTQDGSLLSSCGGLSVSAQSVIGNPTREAIVRPSEVVDNYLHSGPKCRLHGVEHGRLVHDEIQRFIVAFNDHTRFSAYFESRDWDGASPDPCTLQFLRHMVLQNWRPIASELRIFSRDIETATAIDVVVLDQTTFNTALLEVKTGMGGAPRTKSCFAGHPETPYMRGPLRCERDSPYNRAVLQLVLSFMMMYMGELSERGGGYRVPLPSNLYVIHINPRTYNVHQLAMPDWAHNSELRKLIYDSIVHHVRDTTTASVTPGRALAAPADAASDVSSSTTAKQVGSKRKHSPEEAALLRAARKRQRQARAVTDFGGV